MFDAFFKLEERPNKIKNDLNNPKQTKKNGMNIISILTWALLTDYFWRHRIIRQTESEQTIKIVFNSQQ